MRCKTAQPILFRSSSGTITRCFLSISLKAGTRSRCSANAHVDWRSFTPIGDNRKRDRDSKVHRMHMFMCGVACEAANGDEFVAWKIMSGAQSMTDWSVSFSGTITSISQHKKFKFFIVTVLQTLKKLRVLKVIRHLPNPFSFGPWHFGSRSLSCGGPQCV